MGDHPASYSAMTHDEFDAILDRLVGRMTTAEIMGYPGVYEILREELNNEILEVWEQENPDKAHPPRLVKCKRCGATIDLNYGEDGPSEHADAEVHGPETH